jgi:hypothetical protein
VSHDRTCSGCHQTLPLTRSNFSTAGPGAFAYVCKPCAAGRALASYYRDHEGSKAKLRAKAKKRHAAYRAKYPEKLRAKARRENLATYGLTIEGYETLYRSQGGTCAVCKAVPAPGEKLCVDHDHGTNVVRGLLCKKCNSMLGLGRDNPAVLRAGAAYLEKDRESKLIVFAPNL